MDIRLSITTNNNCRRWCLSAVGTDNYRFDVWNNGYWFKYYSLQKRFVLSTDAIATNKEDFVKTFNDPQRPWVKTKDGWNRDA